MASDEDADNGDWLRSVNGHLGARIRFRRKQMNMSQSQLGDALGLTFQQVQKYEHGSNRISAARLLDMANVLHVPITFFFDGMPDHGAEVAGLAERQQGFGTGHNRPSGDDVAELVRAYHRLRDPLVREHVVALLKVLPSGAE